MELRWIPSRPGYLAGDDGNIYSSVYHGKKPGESPRKLKPGRQVNGYMIVNPVVAGKPITSRVHSLVCEAFHGPRPEGMDCSHLDDDKGNNRPDNLCWETPLANQRRRHANGIDDRGSRNSRASLTLEQVRDCRRMLNQGMSTVEVAAHFGCSRPVISRVKNQRRYQNDE